MASATVWAAVACGGATASPNSIDAGESQTTPDASLTSTPNDAATNEATTSDGLTPDAGSRTVARDSGSPGCVLVASNYDQSCAVDSDCIEITGGNYCTGPQCRCGGSAIRASAEAQFRADVARVHDGGSGLACPCAPTLGPCCRGGICTTQCWSPTDTLPACTRAGGTCIAPNTACTSAGGAPRVLDGGCAFPDEMCCL